MTQPITNATVSQPASLTDDGQVGDLGQKTVYSPGKADPDMKLKPSSPSADPVGSTASKLIREQFKRFQDIYPREQVVDLSSFKCVKQSSENTGAAKK